MKPKKLVIKGLNSFIEKQEIDFETLVNRGLFGIFGPTGSGKSSILDAITMALYGDIARDSTQFINLDTDSLFVSYEFQIASADEREDYIVSRTVKRDKKGGYKTTAARLVKNGEEEEEIIADKPRDIQKNIESIIGLTAEDFTRSVVLPQGKFSEFLKLSGKSRRDMLERIFGLEKYGKKLSERIRKARNKQLSSLTLIEGRLEQYKDISKEKLQELNIQYENLLKEKSRISKEKEESNKLYEKYKNIWELQEELDIYLNRLEKLKKGLLDIEGKKVKVEKGKNALNIKPYIDEINKIEEDRNINEKELNIAIEQLKNIDLNLKNLEDEYKKASKDKEEKIPLLMQKENNLLQAIEINKKIEIIKREKATLVQKYKEKDASIKNKNIQKRNTEDNINKISEEIKLKEEEINFLKIDGDRREKIQKLYEIDKEYKRLNLEVCNITERINIKIKSLEEYVLKYKDTLETQKDINKKLEYVLDKREDLIKNSPGNNDILLDKKDYINKLSETFNNLNKINDKKQELEKNLKEKQVVKLNLEKQYKEILEIVKSREETVVILEEKIKNIEKMDMASILAANLKEQEPCPVCGSMHHIKLAKKVDIKELEILKEEHGNILKELENIRIEENKKNILLISIKKEEELILEELENLKKQLKNINLQDLRGELQKEKNDFHKLNENIKFWEEEKLILEENINKLQKEKNHIDKEEAKKNEAISKEKELIASIKKDREEKEILFKEKEKEHTNLKEEIKVSNVEEEINKIRVCDKKVEECNRVIKNKREILDTENKKREEIIKQINTMEIELGKIIEAGKEKKNFIDKEEEEIKKLNVGEISKEHLDEVKKSIENIKGKEETLKSKLELEGKNREVLWENKISKEQIKINLEKLYNERFIQLNKALEENKFHTLEDAKLMLICKEEIKEFEREIEEFEKEYNNLNMNIERVNNKLKGERIEEERWKDIRLKKENKEKELEDIIKNIVIEEKLISDMESNIKALKELLDEKEKVSHKKALLEDIDKLVQGNKFVEFVAMNQLEYIVFEASKRLKDITRGRYALELDCNGNFTMRDDFNGGGIRPTNTLSGGETFLTSLALALALSSQIQLKGSSPLEFFFLDEGFGTLDSELLDTVMTSLENLRSDRLSVGIISHVEELKNRVPIKLIVDPAVPGEGGSKIKIEYS
ncbi:exonuclease SbcC [Clostridium sporogenes]|uniref:AAA family ATPase n=1 Tax=Clostridium sporogenes TaxID=1509 RepID=UPI0013D3C245|nr:AAA family ATPase [Clostridium sporogenes]MBA4508526.1 AAA family ATPase [Clostridium sporogenes]MDU6336680.1 AAA family ATPase [Clostridium sporogenes]NFQ84472.1 exonuclease SbcC [Clostridium sporogenes]